MAPSLPDLGQQGLFGYKSCLEADVLPYHETLL